MVNENRSLALNARVLVVEDDATSRNTLVKLLAKHGIDVQPCVSGHEAAETLKKDPEFDIIVSDWAMPSMDGLELLAWVRGNDQLRSLYFIMVTAKDNMEDKIIALDSGADDYLTKPFHHEELLARVRAGLRIRALQNELLDLEKRMAILQVATAAGHEINNPLTGVFGFLDLIRDGLEGEIDKEKLTGYLDRVYVQTERIRNIVSSLMTLKEIQVKQYIGDQRMLDLQIENGQPIEEKEETA